VMKRPRLRGLLLAGSSRRSERTPLEQPTPSLLRRSQLTPVAVRLGK
jgi:hypothetical protein